MKPARQHTVPPTVTVDAFRRVAGRAAWRSRAPWLVAVVLLVVSAVATVMAFTTTPPNAPLGLNITDDGLVQIPIAESFEVEDPALTGPAPTSPLSTSGPRLQIPALGIDAALGGNLRQGTSGGWIPPTHDIGIWSEAAAVIADSGTTMLAGHVWVGQAPGVLFDLRHIAPGNVIAVTDGHATQQFLVTARYEASSDDLPETVWGTRTGPRKLVLVTCAGEGITRSGQRVWSRNLIVEASLYTNPSN